MLERVLYVVNLDPSNKYGSLEEQIFLTSEAVAKQGGVFIPAFSAALPAKEEQRYRLAGLAATSLPLGRFNILTLRKLQQLIDQHRIDVVHWNLYHPINGYAAALRLTRPRLRHYLTDHNSRPTSFRRTRHALSSACKKLMLGSYSKVLAVSNYVLLELERQAIWCNLGRYHHFVNTSRFQPDAVIRSTMRCSQGVEKVFVVLVVAHLIQEKGVHVAIQALKDLPTNVALWIVGDGPERLSLEHTAESLGVRERITFCGLQAEVSPFMQAADCFVCPSLWEEAAGLVILEAMACGLPVIGSAVGGIPEFITQGQTGSLFPAGDHVALAAHICHLYSSGAQREEMRVRARALAVAQFSHESRVSDAVAIYNTTCLEVR
ncbi:glycosyltransferase family 4 protein [Nitrospira lenta]|uniref:Putative Glycogen synthase n=1 Tax=Nitrospira lenta TaxID=1436998 RepID=A0A330L849_9BACT|nr:glycosyltransferase family 4 protein [Nitrospira lenta]SPP65876.1 putative Glycogen synthase [Nitrospira lenta]